MTSAVKQKMSSIESVRYFMMVSTVDHADIRGLVTAVL